MPIIPMIVIPMTAVAAALLAAAPPAAAQPWPTRPMTMVVPFAAGGASDVIARVLAEGLRMELGQPALVENVGGAGGMVGSSRIAKAAPDGYQMVLGNVGTQIGSDLVTPERMSPEHLGKLVAAEIEKWARVIKASGIALD